MKTVILTEGGSKIGFGHVARCVSVCQAFEEKGAAPEIIVNGDNTVTELLKGNNYTLSNWLKDENALNRAGKADVVIIDSYLAEKELYYRIFGACLGGILVMIDDYARIEYPEGIVVNPSVYGEGLGYPDKEGVTYLCGKDYVILRKEFRHLPEKAIADKVKNILITLGGANNILLHSRVAGCFKDRVFNIASVDTGKDIIGAQQMIDLMLNADICISGGGQTIYELARAGVPAIGVCLSENQRLNLEGCCKKGFIEYIGWQDDKELAKNLESAMQRLSSLEARIKMSRIGKKIIDGRGAERIADKALKYLCR